jgi:hypothetical protein
MVRGLLPRRHSHPALSGLPRLGGAPGALPRGDSADVPPSGWASPEARALLGQTTASWTLPGPRRQRPFEKCRPPRADVTSGASWRGKSSPGRVSDVHVTPSTDCAEVSCGKRVRAEHSSALPPLSHRRGYAGLHDQSPYLKHTRLRYGAQRQGSGGVPRLQHPSRGSGEQRVTQRQGPVWLPCCWWCSVPTWLAWWPALPRGLPVGFW